MDALQLILILAMMIAVVAFIVLVERGERRIPVQYAKRVIGRRVMGGNRPTCRSRSTRAV
jgi:preprotein translocase subunit SecY